MLAALIVTAAVALIAVSAPAAQVLRRHAGAGPTLVGRTVVVNTQDDQTIRGVLHAQYADRWTLRDAVYMSGGTETPARDLVHVPVSNVGVVQEIERPV
jgi:hypothetical protein